MKKILDLRYFGSVVRSDADQGSDLDILCVTSNADDAAELPIERYLDPAVTAGKVLDVSHYGENRIKDMWATGHLFAWHIYLESKPIADEFCFLKSLGQPSSYEAAYEDISRLKLLIEDVRASLMAGTNSLNYEAGLLYVAARNIAISASWYSENGLNFSRYAPYSLSFSGATCVPNVPMGIYKLLCAARHASMRSTDSPSLSGIDLIEVCATLITWVDSVLISIGRGV
ncbi:nucleotidyltransferase domain-containing protein [Pseudomonas viridiflava]|uniref:nucleotidyltransferase domain-containing protein n=1 Tax=Pseudomonas viridiflava TaxID=33069 RepID=UPI000F066A6B|nr:nucleotidyltransferase domain-containing protein [Pseudomonas viridiflava]